MDTGANVSTLNPATGKTNRAKQMTIQLADGQLKRAVVKTFGPIEGVEGHMNLLGVNDFPLADTHVGKPPPKSRGGRPSRICSATTFIKPRDILKIKTRLISESEIKDKNKLKQILDLGEYSALKNDVGFPHQIEPHVIRGAMPPRVAQYPIDGKAIIEIGETIRELEALGVLEQVRDPPCNLPIQAVAKPDGTYRLVCNLVELNKRSARDSRSLINPNRTTKTMPNLKYKTCLDLANGFWSIPLEKFCQLKTSFTFKGKSYCWTRLPQGYHNSPNAFQTVVEDILEGEPVVIYIDDIYITTDTEEEHLEVLERVILK